MFWPFISLNLQFKALVARCLHGYQIVIHLWYALWPHNWVACLSCDVASSFSTWHMFTYDNSGHGNDDGKVNYAVADNKMPQHMAFH